MTNAKTKKSSSKLSDSANKLTQKEVKIPAQSTIIFIAKHKINNEPFVAADYTITINNDNSVKYTGATDNEGKTTVVHGRIGDSAKFELNDIVADTKTSPFQKEKNEITVLVRCLYTFEEIKLIIEANNLSSPLKDSTIGEKTIPNELLMCIAQKESGLSGKKTGQAESERGIIWKGKRVLGICDANASSGTGAKGLMQITGPALEQLRKSNLLSKTTPSMQGKNDSEIKKACECNPELSIQLMSLYLESFYKNRGSRYESLKGALKYYNMHSEYWDARLTCMKGLKNKYTLENLVIGNDKTA